MSPTHASMLVLLGILMVTTTAHGDESGDVSIHNEDTLADSVVVRNWTLICEHLCSLNLSGPACGLECVSTEKPVDQNPIKIEIHKDTNFPTEHQSELCETLCDNGLGGSVCKCTVKIFPAASAFHLSNRPNRNKVCLDICRFHHYTLRGCSQCPFEGQLLPFYREYNFPPSETTQAPDTSRNSANWAQLNMPVDTNQVPTDPPTPDWNRLCVTLCRQGTGGILCNCDLAPF